VVDEQHMPAGPDDVAEQLAVVAVGGEEVRDAHARFDPGEPQQVGGMIERVAFEIVAAAAGMCDRGIVDVGGPRVGTHERHDAEQNHKDGSAAGREGQGWHAVAPWNAEVCQGRAGGRGAPASMTAPAACGTRLRPGEEAGRHSVRPLRHASLSASSGGISFGAAGRTGVPAGGYRRQQVRGPDSPRGGLRAFGGEGNCAPRAGPKAPLPLRLTPRGPIPRIARLCRAGLIYTPAPKTPTYEYRAASHRRPGVLRRSLIARVAPAAEILETG